MSPYRKSAAPIVLVQPHGLVRANGSRCLCKAPGQLWCWWFDVRQGDTWTCPHGGAWVRQRNRAHIFGEHFWRQRKGSPT